MRNSVDRLNKLYNELKKTWNNESERPESSLFFDRTFASLNLYQNHELWKKIALSDAYAMTHQDIIIHECNKLIGRSYITKQKPLNDIDPSIEYLDVYRIPDKLLPDYKELREYQMCSWIMPGHNSWNWRKILELGTNGMRKEAENLLQQAQNDKSCKFYKGVIIMLNAVDEWNDLHISELKRLGRIEDAELLEKVPRYPANSFREAMQSFYMQHLCVLSENPFGGMGPGRLDYYLWPYLEKDLKDGICTLDDAAELIEELFLLIEDRLNPSDGWVEAIVVGGSTPDGQSAVNPLTYLCIKAIMKYPITHPNVYVRMPENPPEDLIKLSAEYLKSGQNRAQIMNDPAIIKALCHNGAEYADAVEYFSGGCMEIGMQGKISDMLYNGYVNLPKILELFITGGHCLKNNIKLSTVKAKGLQYYNDYDTFYNEFLNEVNRIWEINFKAWDIASECFEEKRPSYLISSMTDNCMERGLCLHGGGAKYHDYGAGPLGIPDVADSLIAIKKAVFDDKVVTGGELVTALTVNFSGYENLRRILVGYPKYGENIEEANNIAKQLVYDIGKIYSDRHNRFGGNNKLVILTFSFSADVGYILGASANGRYVGTPVAHSVTPHSQSMKDGITSAMNSYFSLPNECFTGGASTMWDLDNQWASENIIEFLLKTFLQEGGQIFQGNMTDVEQLIKAQKNPENYPDLIVRVGGFSSKFNNCPKYVQDEIIERRRHKK